MNKDKVFQEDYLVGLNRAVFFHGLARGSLCLTTSELGLLLLLIGKRGDLLLIACYGIKYKIYHLIWKWIKSTQFHHLYWIKYKITYLRGHDRVWVKF